MSHKRPRSPSPSSASTSTGTGATQASSTTSISSSSLIEDRKSTFVAHYSPTLSARTLQAQVDFQSASHRIAAWRKPSAQRALSATSPKLYDTGHDDDGEQYAGKKLERLLNELNVEGAVVVARWYGGVLLGPVRFDHIEKCAKEAILKWKSIEEEVSAKKRKIADEDVERVKLAKELEARDQSITVLRALLVEKSLGVKESSQKTASSQQSPTSKKINYHGMALPQLRQLDKARDATISWILKQIDEAEQRQNFAEAADNSNDTVEKPAPSTDK